MRTIRLLAVACVAVLTACGPRSGDLNASSGTSVMASATAIAGGADPSLSAAPTPPPFPEASPVTVAGWQSMTSTSWAGYTFPVSGVTGVRTQWIQPSGTGPADIPADAQVAVWVGIGGWNQQSLIQAGTYASPQPYTTYDAIWYELLPAGPHYQLVTVVPGDKIAVSIIQLRPPQDKWQISIDDTSADQTFTQVVQYDSPGTYPSFIVEDPYKSLAPSSPLAPFPHWGAVSFSNMQIRIGDQWKPAASIYGYRLQMVQSGLTVVTTGPLDKASGFTAHQVS